jgi:uncharacterized membrane protein
MLGFFKKKPENYFSVVEKQLITDAIQKAEHRTSGEIRVFIEGKCPDEYQVSRAKTIFSQLQMANTAARNGVLVYVAMKSKKLAVFGDQGIHDKVGDQFWDTQVQLILQHFNKNNYAEGIAGIIQEIGEALATHFPYDEAGDKNELPDDIVFGN